MLNKLKKREGQIWIETVIYTLIGLALIGIVLAVATPQINKLKEKRIVEQSVGSLIVFDETIKEVLEDGQENRRVIKEFSLKKGDFYIDGESNSISLILKDFTKPYSEPGTNINQGSVIIRTESIGKKYNILLLLNYSKVDVINLTYQNRDLIKKFNPANIPYSFNVDNEGLNGNLIEISISETSSLGGVSSQVGGENPLVCSPPNCNDDNDCTMDSCNSGICSHPNVGNGNTCNGGQGSCSNGVCIMPTAKVCGDFIIQTPNDIGFNEQCDGEYWCNSTCVLKGNFKFITQCGQYGSFTLGNIPSVYIIKNDLNVDVEANPDDPYRGDCLRINNFISPLGNRNLTIDGNNMRINCISNSQCWVGVKVESSRNVNLKNIIFDSNVMFSNSILLSDSKFSSIENITINRGHIALQNSDSNRISGNNINMGDLMITDSGNNLIFGNLIYGSFTNFGVSITGGNGNNFTGNNITKNKIGIWINGSDNIFRDNYVCNNGRLNVISEGDFMCLNDVSGTGNEFSSIVIFNGVNKCSGLGAPFGCN